MINTFKLKGFKSKVIVIHSIRFSSIKHDVVVIGGGPGGYFAAIKAAQLGFNTACVEKRGKLGGTCLNVGCIPSKSLLNNTHLYHQIKHDTKSRGIINVENVGIDFSLLMKSKEDTVSKLTSGIEMLFKKNKVKYYKGEASFIDQYNINIKPIDKKENFTVEAKNIIIATGSESSPFPGITVDEEVIVSSTGMLSLKKIPNKIAIIGAGVIGLEMASVYSRIGSDVKIFDFKDSIGATMDSEVSSSIQKILKKQGLKFQLSTKILGSKRNGDKAELMYEDMKNNKTETAIFDVVLLAVGRKAYIKGLNIEKIGLETDKLGRLIINSKFESKYPNIKVIGDATFGPMLAHKAEEEGIAAVEYLKHNYGHVNYANIPSVLYTHPEVAWTGETEESLKSSGIEYKVGKFPFLANSRAKTNLDTDGFVKVIADKKTQRILGVHIIGPNAGEMIGEASLALEYGASPEDISRTCHAHPTLSEAFKEAALGVFDKTINI